MTDSEDDHAELIRKIEVQIKGVAKQAAECSRVVLRETSRTRLSFLAKLVDTGEAGTGVRGHLVYERRKSDQDWADLEQVKLNSLKAGQSVAVELHTAEVLELRQWLADLQLLKDTYGVPVLNTRFIGIRKDPWPAFTGRPPVEVLVPAGDGTHLADAIRAVLGQQDLTAVAAALSDAPVEDLLALRRQAGVSALDQLLAAWDADPLNDDEEHWQQLLTAHTFALEQVFHVPTVVVGAKAYVGGKQVTNQGGNIADFLLKSALSGRAMVVEIKRPTTPLIHGTTPYRNSVWNVSKDLTGSILQVLTYRDSLHAEMLHLDEEGRLLRRAPPGCAVIIGHTDELSDGDRRRSFELARHRPDVIVLTFDELRLRLGAIRDALIVATSGT